MAYGVVKDIRHLYSLRVAALHTRKSKTEVGGKQLRANEQTNRDRVYTRGSAATERKRVSLLTTH